MEIAGNGFRLRPWQKGDEVSLAANANNKKIWDNVRDYFPYPYLITDAKRWIELMEKAKPVSNFAIEIDGEAVGGIGLILRKDVERIAAEIGYWLGEKYWGQGIMTEAVKAIIQYGFTELGLVRIFAGVFEHNQASMRVLEKAGMQKEAVLKKALIKNGKILDEHLFAILRDDFFLTKKQQTENDQGTNL